MSRVPDRNAYDYKLEAPHLPSDMRGPDPFELAEEACDEWLSDLKLTDVDIDSAGSEVVSDVGEPLAVKHELAITMFVHGTTAKQIHADFVRRLEKLLEEAEQAGRVV